MLKYIALSAKRPIVEIAKRKQSKHGTGGQKMAKVWCATIECKHNKKNQCKAKEINISDGHIHTVHQGYKQIWLCGSCILSDPARELEQLLKNVREQDGN